MASWLSPFVIIAAVRSHRRRHKSKCVNARCGLMIAGLKELIILLCVHLVFLRSYAKYGLGINITVFLFSHVV